ncbi:MAG: tRNA lysidine(34) synthetase TilS [Syntrophomonadaceae bacterium]|nr:tRNA lysidine(34) synthetase TilS [Syntrophomonadaceae bacterium]
MEKKVSNYITKHNMVKENDHIILAVSGGPDSMALLSVMSKLKKNFNYTLTVAHVNHSLRPEADEEESFVKKCSLNLGIPFYSHKADIKQIATQEKKSIEEVGRIVRYQFFNQLLNDLKADLIATAHHQDDNAETVLLNLLRGTGIKGLRGILPVNNNLIRPLLGVSKSEIMDYIKENSIPYCIDESNFDPIYLRNKIRNELIPLLEREYNPRIIEGLSKLALIAREENEYLEGQTQKVFNEALLSKADATIRLNNTLLSDLPIAIRKRVLLHALGELAGEEGWEANDIDIILDMMTKSGSSKMVKLKKDIKVGKVYDELVLSTLQKETLSFDYLLDIPTNIVLPTGDEYLIKTVPIEDLVPEDYIAYVDYDKCELPLHFRSRKPGDVFSPYGLKGKKKLKDFFIDLKVPSSKRDEIPLLTSSQGEIYAVVGYRVSNLAAVDKDSKRILVIKKLKSG